MSKSDPPATTTSDPAFRIINAVANLQAAFIDAGLREPLAMVLAGEIEVRRLEGLFNSWAMHRNGSPWEGASIRGMKVICNVQA